MSALLTLSVIQTFSDVVAEVGSHLMIIKCYVIKGLSYTCLSLKGQEPRIPHPITPTYSHLLSLLAWDPFPALVSSCV